MCPPSPSEILQKANPSFTSACFPESLCLTDRSLSRDYGFLVVFAQSDEPEFWSPLFAIPTLLRSSRDQRSGGTLPACILEPLADQGPGEETAALASEDKAAASLAPLPFPAAEGQLRTQVEVG